MKSYFTYFLLFFATLLHAQDMTTITFKAPVSTPVGARIDIVIANNGGFSNTLETWSQMVYDQATDLYSVTFQSTYLETRVAYGQWATPPELGWIGMKFILNSDFTDFAIQMDGKMAQDPWPLYVQDLKGKTFNCVSASAWDKDPKATTYIALKAPALTPDDATIFVGSWLNGNDYGLSNFALNAVELVKNSTNGIYYAAVAPTFANNGLRFVLNGDVSNMAVWTTTTGSFDTDAWGTPLTVKSDSNIYYISKFSGWKNDLPPAKIVFHAPTSTPTNATIFVGSANLNGATFGLPANGLEMIKQVDGTYTADATMDFVRTGLRFILGDDVDNFATYLDTLSQTQKSDSWDHLVIKTDTYNLIDITKLTDWKKVLTVVDNVSVNLIDIAADKGVLTVSSNKLSKIIVFDLFGNLRIQKTAQTLSTDLLEKGIYVVQVTTDSNKIVKKVIIK